MPRLIRLMILFTVLCFHRYALAAPKNGFCQTFQQTDIPVGNFHQPLVTPQSVLRITQHYNTSKDEGYCMVNGLQPSGDSSLCVGQKIYFGHDGLDMHPQGSPAGQEDIHAVQPGIVVASHSSGTFSGWGESIIIATRTNPFSEEILTFHYHHLFFNSSAGVTSRLFGACDQVEAGEVIAKEGGTPSWPTHLHFGIKHWANIKELQDRIKNAPGLFYGYGYTFGDDSKIANFIDPQGFLLDSFKEFIDLQSNYATWQWSNSYVLEMRSQGWFFGDYDGRFGVNREVKRREATRWIKQAMRLSSVFPAHPHFADVPLANTDSPYVESLLADPLTVRVVNPDHSCTQSGTNFCPESDVTRAEALKMIVAGFYQDEFLDIYNNWIWQVAAPLANNLLWQYDDVSPYSWYAPYVYFGLQNGLLTKTNTGFNPDGPVYRAELAKWLVIAAGHRYGASQSYCQSTQCPSGNYCDESHHQCLSIPLCVPQEDNPCPLGGGYQLPSKGNSGVGGAPPSSGTGSDSSNSSSASSSGAEQPANPYTCQPGQDQLTICPGGSPATYRVCLISGQWSSWNPPCFDASLGSSSSSTSSSGSSSSSSSGIATSSGFPGSSSSSSNSSSASSSGNSTQTCSIVYYLSPIVASCYSNPASSGSPTLCLETALSSGSQSSWRLCKQTGFFQNAFNYELQDQNNLSHFLGGIQSANAGAACTPWQTNDFSYISQNGPQYGAGLQIEVHSPAGCTSSTCTYYTGITTIYRECQ